MPQPLIHGIGLAVGWIAKEVIYVGQVLIRTAYEWLRWSERQ